ncbi:hypothetical protein Golob_004756, partial [Gossypium lobatum]|nr:hypothetical protein [Gossypium lobatum]
VEFERVVIPANEEVNDSLIAEKNLNRRLVVKLNQELAKYREVNDLCLEKPTVATKGLESSKCLEKKWPILDGVKLRKKNKKLQHLMTQNVVPECNSKDLSLVFVLVFDQFIIDYDVPTSGQCFFIMYKFKRGHDRVFIQSDNLGLMRAIYDSKTISSNYSLIRRIQQILSQEGQWFLRHTPRENNQVVDGLAKMTFGKKE